MTIQSADIFNISTDEQFRHLAIDIFHYQYLNNNLYRQWVDGLNINYKEVTEIYQIPFLPIQFFKSHSIVSGNEKIQKIFQSSGTTESIPSLHHVSDISLYEQSFNLNFKLTFGIPEQYHILALLPSYLEREGSSLVFLKPFQGEKMLSHPCTRPGSSLYRMMKGVCPVASQRCWIVASHTSTLKTLAT